MAVHFTASTQTYTASNGAPGANFTYVGWVYLDAVPTAYSMVFGIEDAAVSSGNYITVGINNLAVSPELRVFSNTGGLGSSFSPTPATWYCVAISVTTTSCTLYWGSSPGSLSSATGTVSNSGRLFTFIGNDSYTEWWPGRTAAVKLWSAALSQAEIQAELASYAAVRSSNLLRVHKLQVPETTDYSGNGNTLTGGTGASTAGDPPISAATFSPPYPGLLVSRLRPYFG